MSNTCFVPTLALALEHPNHLGYLKRGNEMKWILAGAFMTLGILKLIDLQDTNPNIGIPLTLILGTAWIIAIMQVVNEKRR